MPFPFRDVVLRIVGDHEGELDQEVLVSELADLVPTEDALAAREQGRQAKAGEDTTAADVPAERQEQTGRRRLAHARLGSLVRSGWIERERRPEVTLIRFGPLARAEGRPLPPLPLDVLSAYEARRIATAQSRVRRHLPEAAALAREFANVGHRAGVGLSTAEYAEFVTLATDARDDLAAFVNSLRKEGR